MNAQTISILIATGFGSGRFPLWPGTFGSLPPLVLAYFLYPGSNILMYLFPIIFTVLSVYSAGAAEPTLGHDARSIVMDEWAGMAVTLLFVPVAPLAYLVAFFWFRLFDVLKLPPAIQAERLPAGWGVTCDDLIAGVQASLATHCSLWIFERVAA